MAFKPQVDTTELKTQISKDLLELLQGVRGKKNLVLQKSLVGVINLLVKFSTLQTYGVDRIFWLEDDNVDSSQKNVVFIASGEEPANAQSIARHIRRLQGSQAVDHDFQVFWVPRRTLVADQILEAEGVLGEISVKELPMYFIALDTDLLSLELNDSYAKLYLDRDVSPIYTAAKGLMALQVKYGLFPRITGKGGYAKRLADLLLRMRLESAISEGSTLSAVQTLMPSDAIDNLIIIDREADPLTPLLTQLTYEGLLDEMYGIQNSQLEVDATILGTTSDPKDGDESIPQTSRGRKRKLALDSTDPLYASLRSENFSAVGPLLHRTAVRLDADFASRHAAKSTADLKAFVQRLPRLQAEQQATKLHTALAEDLIRRTDADLFTRALELEQNAVAGAGAADPAAQADTLHDLICRELPLPQTLRLLCICSLAANGLRARELDSLRRAVLHAYGFRHLLTLDALARMGLLTARAVSSASSYLNPLAAAPVVSTTPSQTSYTTLRAPLKLVDDDNIAAVATGSASPGAAAAASGAQKDISYAYSGYAPLSVRLLQCALQKPTVLALSDSKVSNAGGGGGSPSPGAGGVASANPPSQGWRPFEDLLKSVRGATFSEIQRTDDPATKARATLIGAQAMTPRGGSSGDTGASGTGGTGAGGSSTTAEKTSIVLFLGGLTRAELAAVRLVGERLKGRRRIVVATTQMLSGSEVVGCAMRRAGSSG